MRVVSKTNLSNSIIFLTMIFIFTINSYSISEDDNTLDLSECIDLAIENSIAMETARMDKTFAHADSLLSLGSILPNVSTSLSFTRSWGQSFSEMDWEEYGIPQPSSVRNNYQFQATLSQPLIAPVNLLSYFSKRANSQAQDISYDLSTEEMVITSAEAYFSLIKMSGLFKAAESSYQASEKHLQYTKVLYEVGGASKIDIAKAKSAERNAKLNLISAEANLERAKMTLNNLIGRDVDKEILVEIPTQKMDEDYDYKECLEVALNNRQDIKQYELLKSSSKLSYASSIFRKFPQVYGNFSYYWNDDEFTTENWGDNDGYSIGVTLSWDLFDNFSTESSIMKARASHQLSKMSYDKITQDIELDVRDAYLSWVEAKKRLEVAEVYIEQTEYELQLAERRYQLSAGSIIELNDAQSSHYTSQTEYQDALYNYYISNIELSKAMGVLDEFINNL